MTQDKLLALRAQLLSLDAKIHLNTVPLGVALDTRVFSTSGQQYAAVMEPFRLPPSEPVPMPWSSVTTNADMRLLLGASNMGLRATRHAVGLLDLSMAGKQLRRKVCRALAAAVRRQRECEERWLSGLGEESPPALPSLPSLPALPPFAPSLTHLQDVRRAVHIGRRAWVMGTAMVLARGGSRTYWRARVVCALLAAGRAAVSMQRAARGFLARLQRIRLQAAAHARAALKEQDRLKAWAARVQAMDARLEGELRHLAAMGGGGGGRRGSSGSICSTGAGWSVLHSPGAGTSAVALGSPGFRGTAALVFPPLPPSSIKAHGGRGGYIAEEGEGGGTPGGATHRTGTSSSHLGGSSAGSTPLHPTQHAGGRAYGDGGEQESMSIAVRQAALQQGLLHVAMEGGRAVGSAFKAVGSTAVSGAPPPLRMAKAAAVGSVMPQDVTGVVDTPAPAPARPTLMSWASSITTTAPSIPSSLQVSLTPYKEGQAGGRSWTLKPPSSPVISKLAAVLTASPAAHAPAMQGRRSS